MSLKRKFSRTWMKLNCDPLDCKRRGADNASGNISFIAPMKLKYFKVEILKDRWRCGVVLLELLFLISFATVPGWAQLKNHKRVTALQMSGAAEGSRVTIVSDSALNDYEAFRRGDRFYVRIPLAEFTSALPRFHGDGFEDVQVQKVGSSVIVSFKLQPGAAAHVDQHSNRLDVIFSAPNRMARRNKITTASNRATSGANAGIGAFENPQTPQRRERITAGPMPPASLQPYRERVVTKRSSERPVTQDRRGQIKAVGDSRKSADDKAARAAAAASKPTPTPTVRPSPSPPGYPALTTDTPPITPAKAANPQALDSSANWRSRINPLQWVSAHRLTTLLAALVLLGLILFLAWSGNPRLKNGVRAKRMRARFLKPKYARDLAVKKVGAADPVNSRAASIGSREAVSEYAAHPRQNEQSGSPGPMVSVNGSGISATQEDSERGRRVMEPAIGPSVGVLAPQNHAWVLKPTIGASLAGDNEASEEDQEREVFEL